MSQTPDFKELGHHLCQHIVGMNPKTIGQFSPSTEKAAGDSDESSDKENKPGQDDGKLEQEDEDQEEESLLNQDFLLDNTVKVGDLLAESGVEVKNFTRFACGEELTAE